MIWWAIAAIGVVTAILLLLKGKALAEERAARKPADPPAVKTFAREFETAWTDVDDFVRGSENVWQYLRPNPYFPVGVVTSAILVAFAVAGGWALGGGSLFYGVLMASIFGIVNVAQAAVSVTGDRGTAEWHQGVSSDRSNGSWALLSLLLLLNLFGAFIGSAVVGSTLTTQHEISAGSTANLLAERTRLTSEISALNTKRIANGSKSLEALQTEAEATRKDAICESWVGRGSSTCPGDKVAANEYGPRCGPQCRALREKAATLQGQANDALREQKAKERLAAVEAQLGDDSGAKVEADPAGRRLEELTQGAIKATTFGLYSVLLLQWVVAVIDFGLWLKVGDGVGRARADEFRRRAEVGNEVLSQRGLAPRYIVPDPAVEMANKALAAPDTIIIEGGEATDPKEIIAKSDQLTEIQQFFDRVMRPAGGGDLLPFGKLYDLYRKLAEEGGRRSFMTRGQFIQALRRYCELLKIEVMGSQVVAYRLGVSAPAETTKPNTEAA